MNPVLDEREEGMISDDEEEGGSKESRHREAGSPTSGYHVTKNSRNSHLTRASRGQSKEGSRHHADSSKHVSGDEEVEEGQIPGSPLRGGGSKLVAYQANSRSPSQSRSRSKDSSRSGSESRSPSRSRSRSRSKSTSRSRRRRKRHVSRSRSRSKSKKRRSFSRSRSRTRSRTRSRSASRSPYAGPIIKDYRRGRRGNFAPFNRFTRGRRPFRRGAFVPHHGFRNKYRDYSRSRSKSSSPKRNYPERGFEKDSRSPPVEGDKSEVLNPADIKKSQKQITQSFLAMLEEKQKKSKMIPIEYSKHEKHDLIQRTHGFVNTFATVGTPDSQSKHMLSFELEKDGWQVIDDAETDSTRNKLDDVDEDTKEKHYDQEDEANVRGRSRRRSASAEGVDEYEMDMEMEVENNSDDYDSDENESEDDSRLKSYIKKKKKRSSSVSSQNEEAEKSSHREKDSKKRSKRKKKEKKKRKRRNASSSSSENEAKDRKRKSKKKKKHSKKYEDSESEEDEEEDARATSQDGKYGDEMYEENSRYIANMNPEDSEEVSGRKEKHKKKKSKRSRSSSSENESDEKSKKKKGSKKKNKKKKSKRKKRDTSSSSSSDVSDSSDSDERRKSRKKKKKKKAKKPKKTKKEVVNKEQKKKSSKKKSKVERKAKDKTEEPEAWPNTIITYTATKPCLQYCINPLYVNDFKETFKPHKSETRSSTSKNSNSSNALVSEYEKFLNEVNPNYSNDDGYSLEAQLRQKLLKQIQEKTEVVIESKPQKSSGNTSSATSNQNSDYLSPSEKRALEKMKKQQQKEIEKEEQLKRQEDLKSAPVNAYYSSKKISSESTGEDAEADNGKENGTSIAEPLKLNKGEEISITFGDTKAKKESEDKSETEDDKKPTAKELLDRIKKKKEAEKPGESAKSSRKFDKLPVIGKLKKPTKRNALNSVANAATAEQIAMAMSADYQWYVQYYMTNYGLDAYSAAYYAQYVMLTNGEYQYADTAMWMQQQGYVMSSENIPLDVPPAPAPSTSTNDVPAELQTTAEANDKISPADQQLAGEEAMQSGNKSPLEKSIEVIVPSTPLSATEILLNENPSKQDGNVCCKTGNNLDANTQESSNSDSPSPPPPPPPPKRPEVTSFVSSNVVTLPNGQKLPPGTCQIVVHPYSISHPLSDTFTADAYQAAYDVAKKNCSFNIYSKTEPTDVVG